MFKCLIENYPTAGQTIRFLLLSPSGIYNSKAWFPTMLSEPLSASVTPVSYTHLDVYKRQANAEAAGFRHSRVKASSANANVR